MKEVDLLDWLPYWTKVLLDVRVSTVVIMLATLANVLVSRYIGRRTREAAEAAKASADAAKQAVQVASQQAKIAADTFEASQRPYFAVSNVEANAFDDEQRAELRLRMKNYGNVPAKFREFHIESVAILPPDGDPMRLSKYAYKFKASGQSVVLPGEDEVFFCTFDHKWLYPLIAAGKTALEIRVDFPYESVATGKEYVFHSIHQYSADRNSFVLCEASMT